MKFILFISMLAFDSHATMPSKFIPSTATQFIFESLIRSTGDLKEAKAPRTIEAKDIVCTIGSGRPRTVKCKAKFNVENREVEKNIEGDNNKFFEYLKATSAISILERAIGATMYGTNRLSCTYELTGGMYYRCVSEVSVKF